MKKDASMQVQDAILGKKDAAVASPICDLRARDGTLGF
jgi:hypothetical protein